MDSLKPSKSIELRDELDDELNRRPRFWGDGICGGISGDASYGKVFVKNVSQLMSIIFLGVFGKYFPFLFSNIFLSQFGIWVKRRRDKIKKKF